MAAAASLCGAGAGTIEGSISFPSQVVPPLTVYAAEIDTARIHSKDLPRGRTNFALEVPPGRYLVFLAPNETGAPKIYGAYTEYSRCAPQSESQCEEHALLTVSVGSKAAHPAVSIDDWYLTEAVAEQIDRILAGASAGAAAGRGPRLDSDPMSAPRFSEYPSVAFDAAAPPTIDLDGTGLSGADRELVQHAVSTGPNFAGHVTAALMPCGTACVRLVLLDWDTGTIQGLPQDPQSEIRGSLPCRTDEAVLFRRDSRLLSISRARGATVVTQYFVWHQKNAALAQNIEYRRATPAFCAVAAR